MEGFWKLMYQVNSKVGSINWSEQDVEYIIASQKILILGNNLMQWQV